MSAYAFISAGLLVWLIAGFAAARASERGVAGVAPGWPYATMTVAFALAAFALATRPAGEAVACAIACIALIALAGPDARTGYLFDRVTLPAACLVVATSIVAGRTGIAAAGVLLLVGGFGAVVVCSRGRLMGLGDVKAMYALGAAFGPLESLFAIFIACLSGVLSMALRGNLQRGAEIRFGPHLAVGSGIALVLGRPLVHGVMGL